MFRSKHNPLWWGAALLAAVLCGGWLVTDAVTSYSENQERGELRALAFTAAASFEPELVATLRGGPDDIGTPAFERVRARLMRIHQVNSGTRFVYLMGQKDGRLFFLADAEPAASPDYSAPGDTYDEETEGTLQVFATGAPVIEPPYRDRWGEWVTGLAPVINPHTGKTIAVLGIDISAQEWQAGVARYRWTAIITSGLIAGIVAMFVAGLTIQNGFNLRLTQLNAKLKVELTARRRAEEGLRLAAAVFENTAEGILVTDAEGNIDSVNPAFERITGFSAVEAAGKNPRILKSGEHDAEFFRTLWTTLNATGKWHGVIWNRRKNGERYPQDTTINVLKDGADQVAHYAAILTDITLQKQLENQLRELSALDGLTGIANRRSFDEALEREWLRAMRESKPLSLVMADIDYFKRYNDHYGHLDGDRCLQQIAATIKESAQRAGDLAVRYGGEEFAVILPSTHEDGTRAIAERIRESVEALEIPHARSDIGPSVTISLGCATVVPQRGAALTDLIARADKALYRAKHNGRNLVMGMDSEPAPGAPSA